MPPAQNLVDSIVELLAAAQPAGSRMLLGLTGCCGSGKSTLADQLCDALNEERNIASAVMPMDGFHLSGDELDRRGLRDVKGSPATFDANEFVNRLQLLRKIPPVAVPIPIYNRQLHEPVADAQLISADIRVVIVEGNYLLLGEAPWTEVSTLLARTWFLDTPVEECLRRVRQRHIRGGCDVATAERKISFNDRPNAQLIWGTRGRADRIVWMPE